MASKRKIIGVFTLLLVLIASQLLSITQVWADPADPDSQDIPLFYVNRSLIEAGDFLLVCQYDLAYAALPTDTADVNYTFRLIDVDGITELGQALPYPYFHKGYDEGVVSFYFTAAETTALLTWGTNYTVRISQNPAKFTTPTDYDFVVDSGAYTLLTDMDDNQLQLAERLNTIAGHLENFWSITLTEEQDPGTVFDSNGEAYFRNAIIGCQAMAPLIFFVQSVDADTSTRVWGSSLSDTYKLRLAGVDGIYNTADDNWIYKLSLKPAADALNIPVVLFVGLICLVACVFAIYKSNKNWQTPMPGYVASLMVVLCAGMLFLGLQMVALIGFGLVFVGGYLIFLRKA
jgi:hypothetical protein